MSVTSGLSTSGSAVAVCQNSVLSVPEIIVASGEMMGSPKLSPSPSSLSLCLMALTMFMSLSLSSITHTLTPFGQNVYFCIFSWGIPIDDLGFTSLKTLVGGGGWREGCGNITSKGKRRENGLIERKRGEQGGGINVQESKSLVTGDSLVDCYVGIHVLFTP